jgi:tRNA pseudouridine38-40 synthase
MRLSRLFGAWGIHVRSGKNPAFRSIMRNIKLILAYDGTDFHGWQRQPGLRTVQEALEDALAQLTGTRPVTNASGRTDAGVHARGQVVHFLTIATHSHETFVRALNAILPHDIRVLAAEEKPQAFHSTLDARSKRYRYAIDNGKIADVFQLRYRWHVGARLDVDAMGRAGRLLIGRHDFRSFETEWPNRTSSVRTIFDLTVERAGAEVNIEVEADGFLYNMVRSITGTLMLVGAGKRAEAWVADVLKGQSRTLAGPTAPAKGLFLLKVNYAESDMAIVSTPSLFPEPGP